jgi:carboxyvinyl-carboxyphosphonate phosphorylmutase
LTIEDTLLPRPFGPDEKPALISIEEGVGKMRAALAGRQDPKLVIVGCTAAMGITGLDDTVARAQAYEAAGVDAVFLLGVKSRAELDRLAAAVAVPIVLGGAGGELMDLDYLSTRGVRVCLQGHQPFMAAVHAVHETLKALREGMPPAKLSGVASPELMKRVTRDSDYRRWTREFLGGA